MLNYDGEDVHCELGRKRFLDAVIIIINTLCLLLLAFTDGSGLSHVRDPRLPSVRDQNLSLTNLDPKLLDKCKRFGHHTIFCVFLLYTVYIDTYRPTGVRSIQKRAIQMFNHDVHGICETGVDPRLRLQCTQTDNNSTG